MNPRWFPLLFVAVLLATGTVVRASDGVDLHAYWDQRCKTCHADAGEFARRFLRVVDGRLQGLHHEDDLDVFLRNHYLDANWVAPVTAMLTAQATTEPVFATRCARCHGSAADTLRSSLLLRDGVLIGVGSGRPVADTLRTHGRVSASQAAIVLDSLERVLGELSGGVRD